MHHSSRFSGRLSSSVAVLMMKYSLLGSRLRPRISLHDYPLLIIFHSDPIRLYHFMHLQCRFPRGGKLPYRDIGSKISKPVPAIFDEQCTFSHNRLPLVLSHLSPAELADETEFHIGTRLYPCPAPCKTWYIVRIETFILSAITVTLTFCLYISITSAFWLSESREGAPSLTPRLRARSRPRFVLSRILRLRTTRSSAGVEARAKRGEADLIMLHAAWTGICGPFFPPRERGRM